MADIKGASVPPAEPEDPVPEPNDHPDNKDGGGLFEDPDVKSQPAASVPDAKSPVDQHDAAQGDGGGGQVAVVPESGEDSRERLMHDLIISQCKSAVQLGKKAWYWGLYRVERNMAYCILCRKRSKSKFKFDLGQRQLPLHFQQKHNDSPWIRVSKSEMQKAFREYTGKYSTTRAKRNLEDADADQSVKKKARKSGQMTSHFTPLNPIPYKKTDKRVTDFKRVLCDAIAATMMPLNYLDVPEFKKLLQFLDPKMPIPSRSTVSRTLFPNRFQALKVGAVRKIIDGLPVVSVSFDLWMTETCGRELLGVNVHGVHDTFGLVKVFLGLISYAKTDGGRIAEGLFPLLKENAVNEKVLATVTDGGGNMRTARQNLLTPSGNNISSSVMIGCGFMPIHEPFDSPCFAHLLNGCMKNAWKDLTHDGECFTGLFKDIRSFEGKKLFRQLRKMGTLFTKSVPRRNKFKELCHEMNRCFRMPIRDVPTRFLSKAGVLRWCLDFQNVLHQFFSEDEAYAERYAHPLAWNLAKKMYAVMDPVFSVVVRSQATAYQAGGRHYWCLCNTVIAVMVLACKLNGHLKELCKQNKVDLDRTSLESLIRSCPHVGAVEAFIICFTQKVVDELKDYLTVFNGGAIPPSKLHLVLCLITDPRYQNFKPLFDYWTQVLCRTRRECEVWIKERVSEFKSFLRGAWMKLNSAQQPQEDAEELESEDRPFDLFDDMLQDGPGEIGYQDMAEIAIVAELRHWRNATTKYMNTPAAKRLHPLKFLQDGGKLFPTVASVSKAFMCIMGSQGDCESIFSLTTYLQRGRRNRLKPKLMQEKLFVKLNTPLENLLESKGKTDSEEHNRFDAYDASATEKFWDHLFDTLTEEYENGNGAVCEFVNYDEEENEFEEDVH